MSQTFFHPGIPLCVVTLTYVAPPEAFDAVMQEHLAWATPLFEQGVALVMGRNLERTGGVMLVRGDANGARALADAMPFVAHGLATAEVTAFVSGMSAPGLAAALT